MRCPARALSYEQGILVHHRGPSTPTTGPLAAAGLASGPPAHHGGLADDGSVGAQSAVAGRGQGIVWIVSCGTCHCWATGAC